VLRWERFGLLPKLVPDAEAALADATAELEKVLAVKTDEYAASGVLDAIPGGNTELGRQHLRRKLLSDNLDVLAKKGRLNVAEGALASLRARVQVPPLMRDCVIVWAATENQLVEKILWQAAPPTDLWLNVSTAASPICTLVGLANAPLLREHVTLIEAIKKALQIPTGGSGYAVKFRGLAPRVAEQCKSLLQQLPATAGRNAALDDLRNFPKHADERDSSPREVPRTVYPDSRPSVDEVLAAR
jgi:hypothetical protein